MPRLQKGARALTDQLKAEIAEIREALVRASLSMTKFNPEYAHDRRNEALSGLDRLDRMISDELEAMLQRNERNTALASLPERVETLEAQIAALKAQIAQIAPLADQPGPRLLRRTGE